MLWVKVGIWLSISIRDGMPKNGLPINTVSATYTVVDSPTALCQQLSS